MTYLTDSNLSLLKVTLDVIGEDVQELFMIAPLEGVEGNFFVQIPKHHLHPKWSTLPKSYTANTTDEFNDHY